MSSDLIAPINISKKNVLSDCNIKCSLVTNYNTSAVNIYNRGSYLSLDYELNTKSNYHIKFNGIKMNVNEVRVYFPSIHTYSDTQTDGELLIVHSGNGSNCIVSIPIVGKPSTTHEERTLATILENVKTNIPNINESSVLNISNFNVANLLHLNVPYYYYQGELVFDPCTQNYNYIVFDKNDHSLHIDNKVLQELKDIFKQTTGSVSRNKDLKILSYNKNGATSNDLQSTDDIYIECKPVNVGGDVENNENKLSDTEQPSPKDNKKTQQHTTFKDLVNNPAFDIVVSFVGLFLLYSAGKYTLKYVRTREN